jgi:adenosylcobinamide-GDP ribazoletransferase
VTALLALRLAVGTVTALPVAVSSPSPLVTGRAMLLAPLAVAPLALAAAAVCGAAYALGFPALLVGLIGVGLLALGTRALHLDGLADTVDGLGSGWDTERALAVMRRGNVGPMGVVALVLVIGAQAAAVGQLVTGWGQAAVLAVIICASRAAVGLACVRGIRAARPDGLGASVAGSVSPLAAALSWLTMLGLLSVVVAAFGKPWWSASVAVGMALLGVLLLLRHCIRRFGGITGDVIGACVETACTLLLLGVLVA